METMERIERMERKGKDKREGKFNINSRVWGNKGMTEKNFVVSLTELVDCIRSMNRMTKRGPS